MHKSITVEEIEALRHHARVMVRELGLLGDAYFKVGVTLAERHLLIELASSVYPDVGEMAQRLLLDKSTVSRLVAKTVKKGFIKYVFDKNDKRRRCLQLTAKGKQALETIEPLAQKQVQDALLMVKADEIQAVYKGIALFAEGLCRARLRKTFTWGPITPEDEVGLVQALNAVMKEYHYDMMSDELQKMYDLYHQKGHFYLVLKQDNKIVGGIGFAPLPTGEEKICMLKKLFLVPEVRGQGLGSLLLELCLNEAKKQKYQACYVAVSANMTQAKNLFLQEGFISIKKKKNIEGNVFFEKNDSEEEYARFTKNLY